MLVYRRVVSADGKTMTVTIQGVNAQGQQVSNVSCSRRQVAKPRDPMLYATTSGMKDMFDSRRRVARVSTPRQASARSRHHLRRRRVDRRQQACRDPFSAAGTEPGCAVGGRTAGRALSLAWKEAAVRRAPHRPGHHRSGGLCQGRADAKALMGQFRRREPERVYMAIVQGHPAPARDTWRDLLIWDTKALIQRVARAGEPAAEEAISDYHVVERLRGASLLEVRLRTGRRNQIRIQAALRGHFLIGERRYVPADGRPPAIRFRPPGAARLAPRVPASREREHARARGAAAG